MLFKRFCILLFLTFIVVCSVPTTCLGVDLGDGILIECEDATRIQESLKSGSDNFDFVIDIQVALVPITNVIENDADNYYLQNYEGKDCVLLYLNRSTREYSIRCYEGAKTRINKDALIDIENSLLPYLRQDDFTGAFDNYILSVISVLGQTADGSVYNLLPKHLLFLFLMVSLFVAIIAMVVAARTSKTAVKQESANSYIKDKKVNVSKDIFLRKSVSKYSKSSSGSGGSGFSRTRISVGRSGRF